MDKQVQIIEYQPVPLAEMQIMATSIAASGMFGVKTADEALALMLLCQAERIHPVMALRRYHIIDHKPAFRADALQGEFEREGAILWHVRDDNECSATFWRYREDVLAPQVREASVKRAMERYKKLKGGLNASDLAWPNELTVIRTMADAMEKGVAMAWTKESTPKRVLKKNWRESPRQMLHARCLTEGVRAINPGLVAGIYTEDEIRDFSDYEIEATRAMVDNAGGVGVGHPNYIEQNVREATANATEVMPSGAEVTTHEDGSTTARFTVQSNEYGPMTINQENYKERIAHFGKPTGRIVGRKVGELEKPVVEWLYNKWRNSLTPSASEDDMRFKAAIEFAYQELSSSSEASDEAGKPQGADSAPTSAQGTETPATNASDSRGSGPPTQALATGTMVDATVASDIGARQAFIIDLRERIDNMVLTEEQAVSYMAKYSVGEQTWKMLTDLPQAMLAYLCTPIGWRTFKESYEKEAKPKVVDKPKATRKRVRK